MRTKYTKVQIKGQRDSGTSLSRTGKAELGTIRKVRKKTLIEKLTQPSDRPKKDRQNSRGIGYGRISAPNMQARKIGCDCLMKSSAQTITPGGGNVTSYLVYRPSVR